MNPTATPTKSGDRPAADAHVFTAPVVREVPRPAPEPPAFAAMW